MKKIISHQKIKLIQMLNCLESLCLKTHFEQTRPFIYIYICLKHFILLEYVRNIPYIFLDILCADKSMLMEIYSHHDNEDHQDSWSNGGEVNNGLTSMSRVHYLKQRRHNFLIRTQSLQPQRIPLHG